MRRAAPWLAWYGGLVLLWVLYVGSVSTIELVAGLCAAAVAATAAEVVRSQGLLRYRVQRRWLRRGLKHAVRVLPDFGVVMVVLGRALAGRGQSGAFRTFEFPGGGDRAVDAGRRAFAAVAASLAPNRYVVHVDEEEGYALVHDLDPDRGAKELM